MIASSSIPPDERIPVALSVIQDLGSLPCPIFTVSPIFIPFFFAKFIPTTHSAASSLNQFPSTCHQGFVFPIPVRNVPPSGSGTKCSAQVPKTVALSKTPGEDQFLEAADHVLTDTSST